MNDRPKPRISNANLALLIAAIAAGVFVIALFKFRPF